MRKFITRNRWGVGLGVVAALLLLVAFVTIVIANRRAETARADAERRFGQTRAIAKTMIFDAYDQVSRVPGSTQARATLARAGLQYLDALAADRMAPFAVLIETGQGYARLAEVIGSGQTGSLGRLADGGKLLDRAQAILERAHRERPSDRAARHALAAVLVEQSAISLYDRNDIKRARAAASQADLLILSDAAADASAAALYIRALAALADTHIWDQQWTAAKAVHMKAEIFAQGLPAPLRDAAIVRTARAGNLRLLGEALHKLADPKAASLSLDQAVALYDDVLAEDPTNPKLIRSVVVANRYRAVVHRSNYRDALAASSIARASELTRRLRDADPDDAAAIRMWLVVAELQSQILTDLKRFNEAFALHGQLNAQYARLMVISGDAAGIRRNHSSALRIMGGNYYNGGAYAQACGAWRQSAALIDALRGYGDQTATDRTRQAVVNGYIEKACRNGRAYAGLGEEI